MKQLHKGFVILALVLVLLAVLSGTACQQTHLVGWQDLWRKAAHLVARYWDLAIVNCFFGGLTVLLCLCGPLSDDVKGKRPYVVGIVGGLMVYAAIAGAVANDIIGVVGAIATAMVGAILVNCVTACIPERQNQESP